MFSFGIHGECARLIADVALPKRKGRRAAQQRVAQSRLQAVPAGVSACSSSLSSYMRQHGAQSCASFFPSASRRYLRKRPSDALLPVHHHAKLAIISPVKGDRPVRGPSRLLFAERYSVRDRYSARDRVLRLCRRAHVGIPEVPELGRRRDRHELTPYRTRR